jgi:UDP-glucose 4-epimerase
MSAAHACGTPDAGHHLILGGCGFIGRHVAALLARAGHRVVLVDRTAPTWTPAADAEGRIEWRTLDICAADWDALLADATVVHHYAWSSLPASANANPSGDLTDNVSAMLSMLDALRRRPGTPVVFTSSGGTVYGKLHRVPVPEDHPLAPITAYGAGKASAEIYLGLSRALHGIDCRVARIANPYGAGQDLARGLGAVTTFLHRALTGQPIVIWGDGEVVRDYVHIADVAAALVTLAMAPRQEGVCTFNIGSGTGVSLNRIVAEIEHVLGRRQDVRREEARPFDVPVSVLDISRARDVLGWAPRLTFADGMARTIADLASQAEFSTLH